MSIHTQIYAHKENYFLHIYTYLRILILTDKISHTKNMTMFKICIFLRYVFFLNYTYIKHKYIIWY